jgi:peptidoglycan/LPS O-acetylase OafA/YrhL
MEGLSLLIFTFIIWPIKWARRVFFCYGCSGEQIEIKNRLPFFDLIKGVAIWAVIFIHVGHFYLHFPFGSKDLLFIDLTNNLTRFAIPLFVICSGLLLNPLQSSKQIKNFYWRKIWRIFVPYILCTIAYAIFGGYSWAQFLYYLISGKAEIPYYFMIVLLQLYLLYPLLNLFREEKYFLPITFLISLICYFIPETRFFYGVPLCCEFIFFFSYGMYCRHKFLNYRPVRQENYLWLFIALFYSALILIEPEYYYNTQLFYGLAIFNLIFYFQKQIVANKLMAAILIKFGQNSLWIYLIHFPIVYWLYILFNYLKFNYYWNYPLIFIASLVVVYWLAKFIQLIYEAIINNILKDKVKQNYA